MTCVFVQLRCHPGKTYEVADAIYQREIVSEMYSTSGDYDLLIKLYLPEGEDVGQFIHKNMLDIEGIQRSLTTMTFRAF
ncbi:MAG: Lrp/AsnC ligand binding domain-containing protein [Albidovulum sp.]|nr:Lrp/AsnC ligand binding domain-containing protein [Albidovulum sp.]MDE0304406.1 Lrp/AsnC ligand binding domain-containing protein [Albidovulum sp.]MDE0533780.1 Lrp/AsnC ligand binding domain-containing protein [Albidovulum sp.]